MQRPFKIGDLVSVLDENIKGTVIAVNEKTVILQDEYGFKREYKHAELVKYDNALNEDQTPIKKQSFKQQKTKVQKDIKNTLVVDLHYQHTTSIKHRILEGQIRKFKSHVNKAIRNRIGIITFIVGVGEGVLRKSIESILKKNNIQFSDAPYRKYGNGAIEVHLTGIDEILK